MALLDVCNAINNNLSEADRNVFYNRAPARDYDGYMCLSQPALDLIMGLNLFYFGYYCITITATGEQLINYVNQVRALC